MTHNIFQSLPFLAIKLSRIISNCSKLQGANLTDPEGQSESPSCRVASSADTVTLSKTSEIIFESHREYGQVTSVKYIEITVALLNGILNTLNDKC